MRQSPSAASRAPRRFSLLLVAALVLAGCSGGDDSDPEAAPAPAATAALVDEIAADTCWGDARLSPDEVLFLAGEADTLAVDALESQPAFTDPVACTTAHGLEVYDVVTLGAEVALDASGWTTAVDPDAEGHQELRAEVAAACRRTDPALQAAADASPLDLVPTPAFAAGTRVTWFPFPHEAWQEGARSFACALRQDVPGTVRYADFRSADLDPAFRVCLSADLTAVACDEPHTREHLLELVATPAVAAGNLPGRKAVKDQDGLYVDLSPEAFSLLDAECAAYLKELAPEPAEGLVAVAEIEPERWGDDQGEFSVTCTVSSPLGVAAADMVETSTSVVS